MKKSKKSHKQKINIQKLIIPILCVMTLLIIFYPKKSTNINLSTYKPVANRAPANSPLPQSQSTYITKISPISYYSDLLQFGFKVPSAAYTTDSFFEFHDGTSIHRVQINEPKVDRSYLFATINTPNDIPATWGGDPYAFVGSINEGESLDTLITRLKSYDINSQYIKMGNLPNSQIKFYLSYNKICNKGVRETSCSLQRMYLFPYEKEVLGNQYHSLAFSTNIPEEGTKDGSGYTEEEVDAKIRYYWQSNFNISAFPPATQKIFEIQDQIANSLVFDKSVLK